MAILKNILSSLKNRFIKEKIKRRTQRVKKKKSLYRKTHRLQSKKSARSSKSRLKGKKLKSIRPPRFKPQKLFPARIPKESKKAKQNPPIGEVTHFYSRLRVCVIKITRGDIRLGERLEIKGHTTRFIQNVRSLQIENKDVPRASKGKLVGLKIDQKARAGDKVYKLS